MQQPVKYADIVLPVPLRNTFTYELPERFAEKARPGCRVTVQFGNRKLYTGIIKSIHSNKPEYEVKEIDLLLDDEPIINEAIFAFWNWIANYYLCTEGEVMKAALPAGLKLESQTQIYANRQWLEDEQLSPTENTVFHYIKEQKRVNIRQINQLTKRNNAYPVIKSLLEKNAVVVEERMREKYRPKTVPFVRIHKRLHTEAAMHETFDQLKRAKKQLELLMLILNELNFYSVHKQDEISKKKLLKIKPGSEHLLSALQKKNIIEIVDVEIDRLPEKEKKAAINQLNPHQEKALNEVYACFREHDVTLLHGVTSSGKTEVYIQLIAEQLKAGKQVLYLLPEIALTSQIIERLTTVFGSKAGIYHSRFNDAERVEIWRKVNNSANAEDNGHQLILGARSALFLPFSKLGLIIVDEEHENSFKQFDPAPRYNARDAAVVLAKIHGAKVLMGTATPSFESYHNAQTGKYGYVQLKQRYRDIELPEIQLADLKEAYKRKQMKAHFTPELFTAMETALELNEQIILFQNRRGFSPFLQCRNCGHIPVCKNCDVSLTYHKSLNNLQCHYCGYTKSIPGECPDCHSADVQTKGFGTEKVEDDLKILFPEIKIGRLDHDSTRSKFGHERTINTFASGKTQILVGTQMITKGLDFDNVALVGILNADNLLNFPDFRAYERAYQLIAQVSGRAGRKNKKGKVIIQTSQPNNEVIKLVMQNNFEGLYKMYIGERKLFRYPPVYRLIYITVKNKNRERAQIASKRLASLLRPTFRENMLGPEYHLISRVQQYFQLMIRIKMDKNESPVKAKQHILACTEQLKKEKNNGSVIVQIDVDPY